MVRRFLAFDVQSNKSIDDVYNYFSKIPQVRISKFRHVTLSFLENIDIDLEYLKSFFNQKKAFKVQYQGIGGFPRLDRARVIWIGVNMEYDIMKDFKYPKNEVYHLTIGRTNSLDLRNLNIPQIIHEHKVNLIKLYQTIIPGKEYRELISFYLQD